MSMMPQMEQRRCVRCDEYCFGPEGITCDGCAEVTEKAIRDRATVLTARANVGEWVSGEHHDLNHLLAALDKARRERDEWKAALVLAVDVIDPNWDHYYWRKKKEQVADTVKWLHDTHEKLEDEYADLVAERAAAWEEIAQLNLTVAVLRGEHCAEEMAAGNGGCGICPKCARAATTERAAQQVALGRLRDGLIALAAGFSDPRDRPTVDRVMELADSILAVGKGR